MNASNVGYRVLEYERPSRVPAASVVPKFDALSLKINFLINKFWNGSAVVCKGFYYSPFS